MGELSGRPASRFPRKTLQVKIVDDEEYEKKDNFFIELGQPQWLKRGISGEGWGAGCGEGRVLGWGHPWGLRCGCSFKLMDWGFPGQGSIRSFEGQKF